MARTLLTTVVLLLALAGTGQAQQRATPQPNQVPVPDRTSSQFGDWALSCVGVAPARQCELTQAVQDRQRQQSALVGFARAVRDVPPKLAVRVPGAILVATPLQVVLEPAETLVLPFRICAPNGCLAELELRDEALLRRLQARPADRPGRVVWRDAGNNEASFNLSFRGFAAALDALAREAR